jgi:hypothetical protein
MAGHQAKALAVAGRIADRMKQQALTKREGGILWQSSAN